MTFDTMRITIEKDPPPKKNGVGKDVEKLKPCTLLVGM